MELFFKLGDLIPSINIKIKDFFAIFSAFFFTYNLPKPKSKWKCRLNCEFSTNYEF